MTEKNKERDAFVTELQAAYDKVSVYPEDRGFDGLMDLLALRNLVPQAIAALQAGGQPVAWVRPDELAKAKSAPHLCRVEPTKRMADFVPLYAAPAPVGEPGALTAFEYQDLALLISSIRGAAKRGEKMTVVDSDAELLERVSNLLAAQPAADAPIDMVLHCPSCGLQHIDAPEDRRTDLAGDEPWHNPPHRSHLCHGCGHIWRPADVPTNGVAAVKTKGKADSPITAEPAPDDRKKCTRCEYIGRCDCEPAPADRQGVALSEPAQVVVSRFVTDETTGYLDKLRFAASEAIRTFEDAGDAMSWSPTIDAIERLKGILHGGYEYHSDDAAVDAFAWAMRDKMEESREKGRSGWDSPFKCSPYRLAEMLIDHIAKGDPVDVGNFAMMLFNRPDARGVLSKVWESRASSSRAEVERDAERLKGLRELCGFVQNGSDTVVKIFEDDATRDWIVKVGEKSYYGHSFGAAIDAAMLAAAEAPNGDEGE